MIGRPTVMTETVKQAILDGLVSNLGLANICRQPGMPSAETVYLSLSRDREFTDRYTAAKARQMEAMADEIIGIADGSHPLAEGRDANERRLMVDTRKWLMSRLLPRKFGDRITQELVGPEGGPVQVQAQVIDVAMLSCEARQAMRVALRTALETAGERASLS